MPTRRSPSPRRPALALAAAVLCASRLLAQSPADTLARRQQRTIDSLAVALRVMQARLDSLVRERSARAGGDSAARADDLEAVRAAALAAAGSAAAGDSAGQAARGARSGLNALNPEISVTGDVRATLVRPGPQRESFEPREIEFSFQSALDPFSYTKIFVSVEGDEVHLEEAYAYWSGLPGHLRLDVGKFNQQLGELNRWHTHALPEGELPLVHRLFLDQEENLGQAGVSLYWPLPFSGRRGTYELYGQLARGTNRGLFAEGDRPSYLSQLSGFWQLSRSTYAQASLTGLYGTNPDTSLETALGVLAARFSWRPPAEAKYKEFTARGELFALRRRFHGVGPTRWGGYVGTQLRLSRRWIAGVRADYVESPDPAVAAHEWELAPTITFWQSEFVYVRAQWTRRRDALATMSDRFTLQAVWAMGPHKHELF